VNAERSEDAERRIVDALARLKGRGEVMTVSAIAKESGADKRTVTKALGTPVDTLRDQSNKGVHRVPQSPSADHETAASDGLCRGGCGRALPEGHSKCAECATAAVAAWRRSRAG
jgi:hypothetical protein